MGSTSPNPTPTGPVHRPAGSAASIRSRVRRGARDTQRIQINRDQKPLLLHQLANAGPMSQARPGHAASYSPERGAFAPAPVFAEQIFHYAGSLAAGRSPQWHSRWYATIVSVSADLSTYTSPVVFELLVDGTSVGTFTVGSSILLSTPVSPVAKLIPYDDVVAVEITTPGSGNADLVVHVEMGVVIG